MDNEILGSSATAVAQVPHISPAIEPAALLAAAQRGDVTAWEQLVRQHETAVYRLAYLLLADGAEAEDVAQEAFIRAFLNLDRFELSRPFRPWILSITANLARNRRRTVGRYWAALRRAFQAEPMPASKNFDLDATETATTLWQAVQRLPTKGREIIYLRYFLELSEQETAVALDIAPGTVKSRLHRARKQLRDLIEKEFPELSEGFRP